MVKAGAPVDAVIDQPLLDEGDIMTAVTRCMTIPRQPALEPTGLRFIGMGVSEEGALNGLA